MKNWLANKIITKEIDGEEIKFRRVPVGTLQKFKYLSEDVSKALALLFKDTSKDAKIEQRTTEGASEYIQEAAHPSNIQLRKTQLEEGIKGIIDTLFAEESFEVLAEVIVKSAWEECEGATVEDIKTKMDTATTVQFLMGAFEASAGDYAELGKSWFQKNPKIQELLDRTIEK